MDEILADLTTVWHPDPPATPDQISVAERVIGRRLPEDYRRLLLWSNGGEGQVGDLYFMLWPVQQLKDNNDAVGTTEFLPGVIAFGSDGGPNCYGFDYRTGETSPTVIQVGLGDLDPESVHVLGASLTEVLRVRLRT